MAIFVLVHGAWGGGWAYTDIAAMLRNAGHEAHIMRLAGLGDRASELSPAITLSTHINDVLKVMDGESLDDIILVGHSYGGMIITAVAAQRATQIRALVYVDAFLPRDGEALWDIATQRERQHYIDAQRDAPGLVAPFPGAPAHLTRHPLLTLLEPVHLNGDEGRIGRRVYIYATQDVPTVFTQFRERVGNDPAWIVHDVASGHGVMQDAPDALLRILLEEAKHEAV